MKATLARAMVVRKRLVGKVVRLEGDIGTYNSVVLGNEREVDVSAALEERHRRIEQLTALKLVIFEASQSVRSVIIGLAEKKAEIAFLNGLDVSHGQVKDRYSSVAEEREAVIRRADVIQKVEALEAGIDELQTRLDHHNATTNVTLPD